MVASGLLLPSECKLCKVVGFIQLSSFFLVESFSAPECKAPFGRAPGAAPRVAPGEALPNGSFVTGFTCEAGPEAIGGLHRQGEAMKSWLHAAYTSI